MIASELLPAAVFGDGKSPRWYVCAWHGAGAKAEAERALTESGQPLSHGCCVACSRRLWVGLADTPFIPAEALAGYLRMTARELAPYLPKDWRHGRDYCAEGLRWESLPQLVGELSVSDRPKAAQRLMELVTRGQMAQPLVVQAKGDVTGKTLVKDLTFEPPEGWAKSWEDKNQ